MPTKIIIAVVSFLVSITVGYFIFTSQDVEKKDSVEEKVSKKVSETQAPTPTPYPSPTPFDKGGEVDLNKELEGVEPEVLESDFENLNQIIKNF